MKKLLAVLIVVALVFSLAACGGGVQPSVTSQPMATGSPMTPGTYESSAQGFIDIVTVSVTVDESRITDIQVIDHKETPILSDGAIADIPHAIIDNQSLDVDAITGATVTSEAIIEAVEAALVLAGADISAFRTGGQLAAVAADGIFEGTAPGFGGEMKLSVTISGGEITDIAIISDRETSSIMSRAFPLIRDRILVAKSPIVDSVTGATITSFAVKTAVANASREAGIEFGRITPATSGPAPLQMERSPEKTDIVIVGGGPVGLGSAISAKQAGVKNIIVVEKLDILSGNGKFNVNFFDIINSEAQRANGNEETIETFMNVLEGREVIPERIPVWAQGANEMDAWLRDFGVQLNYNWGGRNHKAESDVYAGEHIQDGMEAKVRELGIDVRTGTKGLDLIMEDGRVIGVVVEDRHGRYNIMANAVILATGGFSANTELLAKYAPGAEIVGTSNQIGATGDFIPLFEQYGFWMDYMDVLVVFRPAQMLDGGHLNLTGAGGALGFIYVNENGERFVNEAAGGLPMAHIMMEQPNGRVFYIYDQNLFNEDLEEMRRLKLHNERGYHVSANTLEELADKLGINVENLRASIDTFNKAVDGDIDDPFRPNAFTRRIMEEGPFYGVQMQSVIHMTRGGVVADEKAQVLMEDGSVVPGLFAAGEVTATLGSYAAAVIFSRIAGTEAAAFIAQ